MTDFQGVNLNDPNYKCSCGNVASSDGFYPCDSEGEKVEPTALSWPLPLYVCGACGLIVIQVDPPPTEMLVKVTVELSVKVTEPLVRIENQILEACDAYTEYAVLTATAEKED